MKAYVVTKGQYEDLETVAICTNEEKAIEAQKHHKTSNTIEIWEMDQLEQIPVELAQERYWIIVMSENGAIRSLLCNGPIVDIEETPVDVKSTKTDNWIFYVRADTKEQAIERANARYLDKIERGEW